MMSVEFRALPDVVAAVEERGRFGGLGESVEAHLADGAHAAGPVHRLVVTRPG
jgi:hypothetical protein